MTEDYTEFDHSDDNEVSGVIYIQRTFLIGCSKEIRPFSTGKGN